jgi:8-oxo-dGTP diphosphatase
VSAAAPAVPPRLRVVAGALRNARGEVLIADRPAGRHLAGRWEFPGGKVAAGETDQAALERELHEELGVTVHDSAWVMTLCHDYPERSVELVLFEVARFDGEPQPRDGQRLKWVALSALGAEDILEADRPFIDALQRRATGSA